MGPLQCEVSECGVEMVMCLSLCSGVRDTCEASSMQCGAREASSMQCVDCDCLSVVWMCEASPV